ncbi:MAG: hypothetical protein JRF30_12585 [Deltaproteobacteria bacterium]|nr:hypothetical protein [Deltaproteobacteria bacterium]MBW1796616.1 hypothetical protein [Deltaproteobacteria bacterium]MBW2331714.1 hypothetical protein [Deltaproteobacteria bacterium]
MKHYTGQASHGAGVRLYEPEAGGIKLKKLNPPMVRLYVVIKKNFW